MPVARWRLRFWWLRWCALGRTTKPRSSYTKEIVQQKNATASSKQRTQYGVVKSHLCEKSTPCCWETLRKRRPPLPAPMPNSRRPPQGRPRQQPREYLRHAQNGPDPSTFRGASDRNLMLRMVQKHRDKQLTLESVAQLRCDTIRSRRCGRCYLSGPSTTGTPGCNAGGLAFCSSTSSGLATSTPRRRQPASKLVHAGHRSHRAGQATARRTSHNLCNGSPLLHRLSLWSQRGRKTSKEPSVVTSPGLCCAVIVAASSWLRSPQALTEMWN